MKIYKAWTHDHRVLELGNTPAMELFALTLDDLSKEVSEVSASALSQRAYQQEQSPVVWKAEYVDLGRPTRDLILRILTDRYTGEILATYELRSSGGTTQVEEASGPYYIDV